MLLSFTFPKSVCVCACVFNIGAKEEEIKNGYRSMQRLLTFSTAQCKYSLSSDLRHTF